MPRAGPGHKGQGVRLGAVLDEELGGLEVEEDLPRREARGHLLEEAQSRFDDVLVVGPESQIVRDLRHDAVRHRRRVPEAESLEDAGEGLLLRRRRTPQALARRLDDAGRPPSRAAAKWVRRASARAPQGAAAAAKARADAERAAAEAQAKADAERDHLATELAATRARREMEHMEASATTARLENELIKAKSEVADVRADLKRWRNGEVVSRSVIDVEAGTISMTAMEASGPPSAAKSARPSSPPSMLSQLDDATARAVKVKAEISRLQDDLDNTTLCILCYDKPRDVVFTGCGHLLSCGDCADKLLAIHGGTRKRTQAPCPACTKPIKSVLSCLLL
mmetsp:Transcript_25296/g.81815  ORF Transcript_25296/g.81815 Transcript_25296/m.81815 type:complete len:338 (+) Transcript_25296:1145-2158(+)